MSHEKLNFCLESPPWNLHIPLISLLDLSLEGFVDLKIVIIFVEEAQGCLLMEAISS